MKRIIVVFVLINMLTACSGNTVQSVSKQVYGTAVPVVTNNNTLSNLAPDDILKICDGKTKIDINRIWGPLGIKSDIYGFNGEPYPKVVSSEKIYVELSGNTREDIIIAISTMSGSYWQFLVFINKGGSYNFNGHIDFRNKQYGVRPDYHIVKANDETRWLVVTAVAGSGTGLSLREESWYRLDDKNIKEDIKYITSMMSAMRPDRDFSLQIEGNNNDNKMIDGKFTVEINQTLKYVLNPLENDLSTVTNKIIYSWNPKSKAFDMIGGHNQDIKEIYKYLNDTIIKQDFNKLLIIAESRDTEKIKWVKKLLDSCDDSPQKNGIYDKLKDKIYTSSPLPTS